MSNTVHALSGSMAYDISQPKLLTAMDFINPTSEHQQPIGVHGWTVDGRVHHQGGLPTVGFHSKVKMAELWQKGSAKLRHGSRAQAPSTNKWDLLTSNVSACSNSHQLPSVYSQFHTGDMSYQCSDGGKQQDQHCMHLRNTHVRLDYFLSLVARGSGELLAKTFRACECRPIEIKLWLVCMYNL